GEAAGTAPATDALGARVRAQLAVFTGWLAANGVRGAIGEVGWPGNADADRWNAVAGQWYGDAAAAGVTTTAWATGEWWGSSYKLSSYTWNTPVTLDGPLSLARPQASVIEAQAGDRRGVNSAGGEFGSPGPLDATSSFSNTKPGVYNQAYHYDTQASFDYLASRGITTVRVPFRWERIQPQLGAPLDPAELQRLADVVGRAGTAGLQVILDVHNYGAYWLFDGTQGVRRPIGSAQVTVGHFADLWRQLSDRFRDVGAVAGYGLMNEPAALPPPAGLTPARAWEEISQAAVDAIRSGGDTKLILVPGYHWSGAQQWTSQHPAAWIVDPVGNHRYEAHHYFDGENSGAYPRSYDEELASAVAAGYAATPPAPMVPPAPTTTTTVAVIASTTTTTPATTTTTTATKSRIKIPKGLRWQSSW
ncbi:MAG: glycoside hydrolase family 5 protein, partial [Acidimicrobiales bacterium]